MIDTSFDYIETDDPCANLTHLTWEETQELIREHNTSFETNYQTIQEFNNGEEYRKIEIYLEVK